MKVVGVKAFRENMGEYLALAQKEDVVVVRHGKPLARVSGVSGREFEGLAEDQGPKKEGTDGRAAKISKQRGA